MGFAFAELERRVAWTIVWLRELAERAREDSGEALDLFYGQIYSIVRRQALGEEQEETRHYEILLTTDGPTIYVSTDGILSGFWLGDRLRASLEDEEEIMEFLGLVKEDLDAAGLPAPWRPPSRRRGARR